MSDKIPPVKNAKYKQMIILGNPRTSPKRAANLTSPSPTPLPRVTKNIIRKKRNAPRAESKWDSIKYFVVSIKYIDERMIIG